MLDHVCAILHRSSRVTSFRHFAGAMSGGGRWPRMPDLLRHFPRRPRRLVFPMLFGPSDGLPHLGGGCLQGVGDYFFLKKPQ